MSWVRLCDKSWAACNVSMLLMQFVVFVTLAVILVSRKLYEQTGIRCIELILMKVFRKIMMKWWNKEQAWCPNHTRACNSCSASALAWNTDRYRPSLFDRVQNRKTNTGPNFCIVTLSKTYLLISCKKRMLVKFHTRDDTKSNYHSVAPLNGCISIACAPCVCWRFVC